MTVCIYVSWWWVMIHQHTFLLMSHQENSPDVQVYTFWSMHSVFLSSLTYFSLQDWYLQFYNVCNWLIVVSPLAKEELPHQNFTSTITWPPKEYSMSRKKVGLPAAESGRNLGGYRKYVLMAYFTNYLATKGTFYV